VGYLFEKDIVHIALLGDIGGNLIDHFRDFGGVDFGLFGKLFGALQFRRRDQFHCIGRLLRVFDAGDLAFNLF